MAALAETLATIKEQLAAAVPAEALATMARSTQELLDSGQAQRALGSGRQLPAFALPNQDGRTVRSSELLAEGPLVLTFFRGHW